MGDSILQGWLPIGTNCCQRLATIVGIGRGIQLAVVLCWTSVISDGATHRYTTRLVRNGVATTNSYKVKTTTDLYICLNLHSNT